MDLNIDMNRYFLNVIAAVFLASITVSCSGEKEEEGLTEFQLEHGIGPITEKIELGELNMEKAERGEQIFSSICSACHQLDAVVTAPRLRNVANRREPEFILNYILNPSEMSNNHPVGQQLSDSYPGVKSDLGISQEQAFEVLEYLRAAANREM
jgi:cytochrome c